jgi:Mrp family chromosome partitioning ATPase
MLDQSASSFSVVIIDTPALEEGVDATLLARAAGAALVVARTNLTKTRDFNEVVNIVGDAGSRVVGSVLIDVPLRRNKRKIEAKLV